MSTERRFESDPRGNPAAPNWPITDQVGMTAAAAEIVPNRGHRRTVTIKNLDTTNTIYIGNEEVSSTNGFPLAAGQGMTLETRSSIWGVCSGGQAATASYLEDGP